MHSLPWPSLILLSALFFLQGLSGVYYLYFSVIMFIIVGAVMSAFALYDREWDVFRRLGLAAGACAVAGVLLIPTLWPYQQVNNDLGIERTEADVDAWSAHPRDYLTVSPSNRLYGGQLGDTHRHIELDLFPGVAVVLLAALGLTNRRGGRVRWVLLAIAVVTFGLSFGLSVTLAGVQLPSPYRLFYDWLPGFRAIRVAARFGLLALLGLAALAGLGVDRLWRLAWPKLPSRLAASPRLANTFLLAILMLVTSVEFATRLELPPPLPAPSNTPPIYAWLRDNRAPAIEVPMGTGPVASSWPNFWSTMHWADVVNAYSAVVPPGYYALRERMDSFPSDDTVRLLQGIGVERVVAHGDEQLRGQMEADAEQFPELELAFTDGDSAWTLAPDPWMWRLAEAVPAGETVDLPRFMADPVAFVLLVAILQRHDLDVTGTGEIDYFQLEAAGSPRCYAILPSSEDPAAAGYGDAMPLRSEQAMTLYRRAGCD